MSDSSQDNSNSNLQTALGNEIIELDFDFSESSLVSEVFFKESSDILSDLDDQILKIEAFPHDEILLQSLFRKIHTLKGSAGAVPGGQLFSSLAHEFESLLESLRKQKIPPNASCCELFLHSSRLLKVLAENLRTHREIYPEELSEVIELITRYGNFQINENETVTPQRPSNFESPAFKERAEEGLWISKEQMASLMQVSSEFITLKNATAGQDQGMSQKLNVLSTQLQSLLEKCQKIQLQEVFGGLFPLARQVAYELRKEVELNAEGFNLEVDKFLAQDLNKALMHMIRNSIDHGIESIEERSHAAKPTAGTLRISISESGSFLYCMVEDDGRGIDPAKVLDRALEKGLINGLQASQLSKEQIFAFIFHPGFSTKERVTTLSGRGVGMDVVQTLITKYNGAISIDSNVGLGCRISLKIPLPKTLQVERCLVTAWKDLTLAFPLIEVSSIESVHTLSLTEMNGLRFCQASGVTTPLLTLHEIYALKISESLEKIKTMSVVFLKTEQGPIGLLIDRVQEQSDLVIKPLSPLAQKVPGCKGTSLITDDNIAFVIEPLELKALLRGSVS